MYEYLGIFISELREYGALVVVARAPAYLNKTVTIWQLDVNDEPGQAYYADVKRFEDQDGKTVYAAVFPRLPTGNYGISRPSLSTVNRKTTIFPGMCEEVED